MNDRELSFPVLGFDGDGDLDGFRTWDQLTICGPYALGAGRSGMVLIDAEGRRFRVAGMTDLGIVGSFWRRVVGFLLRQHFHRVDHQLIEEPPFSLEALKQRVCDSITAHPDSWRDDEAIAGEDGPPIAEEVLLEAWRDRARGCRSVAELVMVLELEGPRH